MLGACFGQEKHGTQFKRSSQCYHQTAGDRGLGEQIPRVGAPWCPFFQKACFRPRVWRVGGQHSRGSPAQSWTPCQVGGSSCDSGLRCLQASAAATGVVDGMASVPRALDSVHSTQTKTVKAAHQPCPVMVLADRRREVAPGPQQYCTPKVGSVLGISPELDRLHTNTERPLVSPHRSWLLL